MIQFLQDFIINNSNSENIDVLTTENSGISEEIARIQDKIDNLRPDIVNQFPQHVNRIDALKSILSVDQQQLLQELQALKYQQQWVQILKQFIQQYLLDVGDNPRLIQTKIKDLKQKAKNASDVGCMTLQVRLMNQWILILSQSLSKKISSLVRVFPNAISISFGEIQNLKDLLSEQICQNLIKNIYKNAFVYDVPTYSYQLSRPIQLLQKDSETLIKKQMVIFPGQKSQQNYNFLKQTILTLKGQCDKISQIVCNCQESQTLLEAIKLQIQNCQLDILSTVEYILPYLSIQRRKEIMKILSCKDKAELSIYDILVKLKTKGQDGDSVSENIDLLVEKIIEEPQSISEVQNFLYICQTESTSLNIAFFVCESLINKLQQFIDLTHYVTLLEIRQSIRFEIHHPK